MFLQKYLLAPTIVLFVMFSTSVKAGPSTFEKIMMSKPAITQPETPFILIFFQTADNTTYFDFKTDGVVNQERWTRILQHTGYIAPYSYFNPKFLTTWSNRGSDIAVIAAQSIGRQSGGAVMTDLSNTSVLNDAYSEPIALGMTHFFDDFEPMMLPDLGAPGGTGSFRLRIDHQQPGSLAAARSPDFYTVNSTDPLSSFTASFDLNQQNYVFGGSSHLFGCRSGGYDGASKGWDVRIINMPGGYQNSNIYFYSDGYNSVKGPQIDLSETALWQHIKVNVVPDPRYPGYVEVTITADHPNGTTSSAVGRVIRPTISALYPADFSIAGDFDTPASRVVDYDNILLTSTTTSAVIAKYRFESDGDPPRVAQANQAVGIVLDESGRNHNLQSAGGTAPNKYTYFPTNGVDPALSAKVSAALTTSLLTSRRNGGAAPPVLLTNYALSDKPGRFGAWKGIGFTHGSTDYYLYSDVQIGFANISDVLKTQRTQWAWSDGSDWHHVWWGNVNNSTTPINTVMTVSQQKTALTLAVLEGNRWFSIFTSMSNGTLASYADFSNPSRMATVNAEVLYALAQAASWFQSTSKSLQNSTYVSVIAGVPSDLAPYCRARYNPTTNEFWFAGFSPQPNRTITINLPSQTGIVTNLATGGQAYIVNGTVQLTLTADAQPYHFEPTVLSR